MLTSLLSVSLPEYKRAGVLLWFTEIPILRHLELGMGEALSKQTERLNSSLVVSAESRTAPLPLSASQCLTLHLHQF